MADEARQPEERPEEDRAEQPSLSRPRIIPIPASLSVPLHVTSSRKVHRSADGIINIIQEISFYAEGFGRNLAGRLLNEVHSHPAPQVRGRFSAETNARVFVGERLIRMHIQTSIRPNSSDSFEFDEVFHFAENQHALVVPISFEPTLERAEGERPAVEFDLSSPIVVTLKQRLLKDSGEQYKVMQAIELRANETEARPIQELARKSVITQPSNENAQFRERIFAGTDVLRVDRDILFVCDRQILSLSERREYMPEYPMPRRRFASLTQSVPRVMANEAREPEERREEDRAEQPRIEEREAPPTLQIVEPILPAMNAPRQEDGVERRREVGVRKVTDQMIAVAAEQRKRDQESDTPSTRYSRVCPICMENPSFRAVYIKCGHIVCYPCAVEIGRREESENKKMKCPICRSLTGFVKLFEDEQTDVDDEKK